MTDLIQLKKYRYKGIDLLFEDTNSTGGNRIIKYNYPGSDKQSIERQGKAPRSFSIPTIIPYENYDSNRSNIIRILEDGEKGTLTHPYWGDIENVVTGTYSLNESLKELGRATITIQYEIDDGTGIPIQSGNLETLTQFESNALNTVSSQNIIDNYFVTSRLTGNFTDAIDNTQNISNQFRVVSEKEEQIPENSSSFNGKLNLFDMNITRNIKDSSLLAPDIDDLFLSLNDLYATPEQRFNVFISLFLFGHDDPVIKETTVGRISRKQNRDIIRSSIRTQALSYAYINAVIIQYDTTNDLDVVQRILENQYIVIRDDELVANDVQEQLDRTRVQAIKSLDNTSVTTNQIITINTSRKPLSVLLYQWYGHTDFYDIVTELNDIHQNSFVDGDIKLLVEV